MTQIYNSYRDQYQRNSYGKKKGSTRYSGGDVTIMKPAANGKLVTVKVLRWFDKEGKPIKRK